MPFNPDARAKRMGAHVYNVEDLDLTAWGFPGVTFAGSVGIDIDDNWCEWYVGAVHALDGQGKIHEYETYQGIGEAIAAALYADAHHSQLIEDACWYHGEG